jgi:hypothetical protein
VERAAIDRLYAVPLTEFVAERDALARRVKAEGDRAAADEIKALNNPTVAAWALDQVARRERTTLRRALATMDRLRAAQRGAITSEVSADDLRRTQQEERRAVAEVRDAAEAILTESGHSPTPAILERVVRTLRGAAFDEEARVLLEAGRLAEEHDEPGFDAILSGLTPSVRPHKSSPPERPKTPRARRIEEASSTKAAHEAERAEREARRKEIEALKEQLRKARDERLKARADASRLAMQAERARKSAEEAVARAERAEADAESAALDVERAEAAVAEIEEQLASYN